jgi:hypothetical protein
VRSSSLGEVGGGDVLVRGEEGVQDRQLRSNSDLGGGSKPSPAWGQGGRLNSFHLTVNDTSTNRLDERGGSKMQSPYKRSVSAVSLDQSGEEGGEEHEAEEVEVEAIPNQRIRVNVMGETRSRRRMAENEKQLNEAVQKSAQKVTKNKEREAKVSSLYCPDIN